MYSTPALLYLSASDSSLSVCAHAQAFVSVRGSLQDLPILDNGYYEGPMYELDSYNYNQAGSNQSYQGGYINNRNDQGGYINQGYQGGYINQGYEQQPQQQQQVVQFTAEQLQQQQPQQ